MAQLEEIVKTAIGVSTTQVITELTAELLYIVALSVCHSSELLKSVWRIHRIEATDVSNACRDDIYQVTKWHNDRTNSEVQAMPGAVAGYPYV